MPSASHLHAALLIVLAVSCIASATAGATWAGSAGRGSYSNMYGTSARAYYGGDITSDAARRVLGDTTTAYISYAALTADAVPCSTAGASYYDCAASDAANPYTRSCTTITLCARDTS
ncbi:hypothetical protein L7F22_048271 [Adiantum nelumboides]|nr:hypothetical protein [Adiantum nelumboides]